MCIRDRPETAAAEAAGELVIATRESADVTNPVEEYNSKYPVSYTHLDVYKRQMLSLDLNR